MNINISITSSLLKALEQSATQCNMTNLQFIEEAIINYIEELEDIRDAEKRMDEPDIPHEEVMQQLKNEGLL